MTTKAPRPHPLPFENEDALLAFAGRALELFSWRIDRPEDETPAEWDANDTLEGHAFRHAKDALRCAVSAAPFIGGPALMELFAASVEDFEEDYGEEGVRELLLDGVAALLARGVPPTDAAAGLLRAGSSRDRYRLSHGLRAEHPAARAVLELYAADEYSLLRDVARRALAEVGGVAWWVGRFSTDPTAGLPATEAAALTPVFTRYIAAAGEYPVRQEELLAALDALPAGPRQDAAERLVRDLHGDDQAAVALFLARLPGGLGRLLDLAHPSIGEHRLHRWVFEKLVPLLASAERRTLALLALERLAALRKQDLGEGEKEGPEANVLAEILVAAWPLEEEPVPLVAVLRDAATPAEAERWRGDWTVAKVVERHPGPWTESAALFLAVLRSPSGGPHDALRRWAENAAPRIASDLVRRAVDDVLVDPNPPKEAAEWAIEALLTRVRDPVRDGEGTALVARLHADPRFRDPLRRWHTAAALPLLRRELREGRLEIEETSSVLDAVNHLYGGWPEGRNHDRPRTEAELAEAQRSHEPYLGPPELRGPLTDGEWDAVAAVRRRALAAEEVDWLSVLGCLRPGPWSEEERSVWEAAMAAGQAGNGRAQGAVTLHLLTKPDPWLLASAEEIVRFSADDPDGGEYARDQRRKLRWKLGLRDPPRRRAAAGGEVATALEQEDEDDDW